MSALSRAKPRTGMVSLLPPSRAYAVIGPDWIQDEEIIYSSSPRRVTEIGAIFNPLSLLSISKAMDYTKMFFGEICLQFFSMLISMVC